MSDTKREEEFRNKCRELLAHGIKPTPKLMVQFGFGNGRTMSGNYVKIRTEELLRFGYTLDERTGRWVKSGRR